MFTSSSTVRNLVGIAGKPHPSTIIAVIGPATARTCEEHGLRVDVVASKPSVVELADALASFAADRRDGFIGGRRARTPSLPEETDQPPPCLMPAALSLSRARTALSSVDVTAVRGVQSSDHRGAAR